MEGTGCSTSAGRSLVANQEHSESLSVTPSATVNNIECSEEGFESMTVAPSVTEKIHFTKEKSESTTIRPSWTENFYHDNTFVAFSLMARTNDDRTIMEPSSMIAPFRLEESFGIPTVRPRLTVQPSVNACKALSLYCPPWQASRFLPPPSLSFLPPSLHFHLAQASWIN